ncbi:MAG: hypothetical protein HKP61_13120 [Dactylosporangium sp.]|nr:hypothetical protein [Dactylosporangium sp.]NNJ61857.1 hypothetical protein [Dactylosporangium sp.]
MCSLSLFGHLSNQLERLCELVGADSAPAVGLLDNLLGPVGSRPLSERPDWPSNVADDNTPVEFSIAFNADGHPILRILGEALGPQPSAATNLSAARRFLDTQADHFDLSMYRFNLVQDLFTTENVRGEFGIWHSIVLQKGRQPDFKVYFNPEARGVDRSPDLVAEALRRLGLARSYQTMLDHGVRPGELARRDRLTFFALDLHDRAQARVKLYLSHHGAEAQHVVRAASAVDGIDGAELAEFCQAVGGGPGPFDDRPLVGSYTFTEEADRPVGYSLYVPIRSYVHDDEEARDRVAAVLERYGFDSTGLDRAVSAVTRRRLRAGVGLIAHASLRLGLPRPGVTVYFSAEAYRTYPPRPRLVPASAPPPAIQRIGRPADRSAA